MPTPPACLPLRSSGSFSSRGALPGVAAPPPSRGSLGGAGPGSLGFQRRGPTGTRRTGEGRTVHGASSTGEPASVVGVTATARPPGVLGSLSSRFGFSSGPLVKLGGEGSDATPCSVCLEAGVVLGKRQSSSGPLLKVGAGGAAGWNAARAEPAAAAGAHLSGRSSGSGSLPMLVAGGAFTQQADALLGGLGGDSCTLLKVGVPEEEM